MDFRAVVGLAYPLVMLAVPRPTMVDAHWLGVTIAPFAGIGLLSRRQPRLEAREWSSVVTRGWPLSVHPDRGIRTLATGLLTVTLAAAAYAVTYLAGSVT